ncbi:orotidine-5'-phosphate decarboxylase [uncultured Desulfovibrio sp.]|uniref:Orotidine 5'-phosphate decarboxylase n=1 Tax=Candidatus Desulfovibrio intestinavium TaxID=2838534 RepID=A0A9D2KQF2_9BACT|nr:orotidine-5'-phosphate decarboxylase [uncultured Desulfovibrio sp.]HJA79722.1 orotidine-5'-phosphate decarboxylase [Candidatus Desulfovibrio intestinavium]
MAELIVALDFPAADSALELAGRLRGTVPWCKVGMELFCQAGPSVLARLRDMGFHVFLDLKFYDIPHTVAQAVRAAARHGAEMLTIHTQGGERMCCEARQAADSAQPPLLFGVTVLTSFGPGQMPGIEREPADFAAQLASMAAGWGLDGVVCSGQEAAGIKARQPGLRCLCPGIRPAAAAADDQCRIMTPAAAVAAGADYLVVGRPITRADDPLAAARAILDEMHTC